MTIKQILEMPTLRDNIHESCFRSYSVLERVVEMLKRGDSSESVLDFIKDVDEMVIENMDKEPFEENTKSSIIPFNQLGIHVGEKYDAVNCKSSVRVSRIDDGCVWFVELNTGMNEVEEMMDCSEFAEKFSRHFEDQDELKKPFIRD